LGVAQGFYQEFGQVKAHDKVIDWYRVLEMKAEEGAKGG